MTLPNCIKRNTIKIFLILRSYFSRSSNGYSNESLESLNLSTEDPESDREMDIEEEDIEDQEVLENDEVIDHCESQCDSQCDSHFTESSKKSEVELDDCIGVEVEP